MVSHAAGSAGGPRPGRIAALICLLFATALPILVVGQRASADVAEEERTLQAERGTLRYARALEPLLVHLESARAASALASRPDDVANALVRVKRDVARVDRLGLATAVPSTACERSWQQWNTSLARWSRRREPATMHELVHRVTCYIDSAAIDSALGRDPDESVQVLTSIVLVNVPAFIRHAGETAALLDDSPRAGYDSETVLAAARSVGYATRIQNNIASFIDEDLHAADPALAASLAAVERKPATAEAAFERRVDAVLTARGLSANAGVETERRTAAAVLAYRPFWDRGMAAIASRLRVHEEVIREKRSDVGSSVACGLLFVGALVALASLLFARRQRRQLALVKLERDALAAHVARSQAERSRSLTERQLRVLFQSADVAIVMFDERACVVQTNVAFDALTAQIPELPDLLHSHADGLACESAETIRFELEVAAAERPRWIAVSLAGVYENGVCLYVIGTALEVTDRKSYEADLLHDALHDGLTGIANRRALEERLAVLCAERRPFTLFFFDLDRFKPVNDEYGHAAGDEVLAVVAARSRALFREGDLVARVGGDEFAVLARDISDADRATVIAKELCATIEDPIASRGRRIDISASVGIAIAAHPEPTDVQELFARADAAMYRAKARGLRYALAAPSASPTDYAGSVNA